MCKGNKKFSVQILLRVFGFGQDLRQPEFTQVDSHNFCVVDGACFDMQ